MKIMIRATNWVGDAILALPALRAVRRRFSDSQISIVARPYVSDIYRDQGVCDECIPYDPKGEHRGWRGRERLAAQIRERQFDAALLLQNAFDAAWLAWRAKIPKRIGYVRDARGFLLTDPIPIPKPGETPAHEMYYYLELLRRAGWLETLPEQTLIDLYVPEPNRHAGMQTLLAAGSRPKAFRIAVAAGASYGSAKCWPPDRFAKALNALLSTSANSEVDIVLFGTPAEISVSSAIASALQRPAIDLTGKTPIADLPSLLSQCHLFFGNDSGAMHVAAAVGLPVVAVFGPTDPEGTAPVTPLATLVQQKPYCSPCFLRRCPTDHRCMTAVTPAMVEAALRSHLPEVTSA